MSQLRNTPDDSLVLPLSPSSLAIDSERMMQHGDTLHTSSSSKPREGSQLLNPLLTLNLWPSAPSPPSPSLSEGYFVTFPPISPPSDQEYVIVFPHPLPAPSDQRAILTTSSSSMQSPHSSGYIQQSNTISLQDNQPASGGTSLKKLGPAASHHQRRPNGLSYTTSVDESAVETEFDFSPHLPLIPAESYPTAHSASMNRSVSPSTTVVGTMPAHALESKINSSSQRDSTETSVGKNSRRAKSYKGKESMKIDKLESIRKNMDPSPFYFNPSQLTSLVNPKSLNSLIELGGVTRLIEGLGTHMYHGLSPWSFRPFPDVMADQDGDGGGDCINSQDPYKATFEDRKRIYGINILPPRRSKSLLFLMWLAFKDKVLVRIVIVLIVFTEV